MLHWQVSQAAVLPPGTWQGRRDPAQGRASDQDWISPSMSHQMTTDWRGKKLICLHIHASSQEQIIETWMDAWQYSIMGWPQDLPIHKVTIEGGMHLLHSSHTNFFWLKVWVSMQQLPAWTEQLKSQTLPIDSYPQHQSSRRIHHPVDSQVPSTWWAAALLLHPLSLPEVVLAVNVLGEPKVCHLDYTTGVHPEGRGEPRYKLPEWTVYLLSRRRARTWSSQSYLNHVCAPDIIVWVITLSTYIIILAHTLPHHYTFTAVLWS